MGAENSACQSRVVGAAIAKRAGKREDPLSDGHLGEHAVHEVCCRIRHAATAAGGAEAAALTGEGTQTVELTCVAVEPQEAVGEDTAAKVGPQLLLDEAGSGLVS